MSGRRYQRDLVQPRLGTTCIVLVASLLAMFLAGCGGSKQQSAAPAQVANAAPQADPYDIATVEHLKDLARAIATNEGGPVIGWITDKILPKESEFEKISKQLDAIQRKLDGLAADIEAVKQVVLGGQKETWQATIATKVTFIEDANRLLKAMTDPKLSADKRAAKTAEFEHLVKSENLEHALTPILGILKGGGASGPGLINKAYEYEGSFRFYTVAHSLASRQLYDDYAYVMLQNLAVQQAYWIGTGTYFGKKIGTGPGEVPASSVTTYVNDKAAEITTERGEVLKPDTVPANSLIDTHTSILWHWGPYGHDSTEDRNVAGKPHDPLNTGKHIYKLELPHFVELGGIQAGWCCAKAAAQWLVAQGWPAQYRQQDGLMPAEAGRIFFWDNLPPRGNQAQAREISADHADPVAEHWVSVNEHFPILQIAKGVTQSDFR